MDFTKMDRTQIEEHLNTLSVKEIMKKYSSYMKTGHRKLKRKSLIIYILTNDLCNFNGTMSIGQEVEPVKKSRGGQPGNINKPKTPEDKKKVQVNFWIDPDKLKIIEDFIRKKKITKTSLFIDGAFLKIKNS